MSDVVIYFGIACFLTLLFWALCYMLYNIKKMMKNWRL